jgi:hypothetical protein
MTRVAIHQSQYIPWAPYFRKIATADIFVVLDEVQYQKNGVQNRNMVRNKKEAFWLTIPVTGHLSDRISDKKLSDKERSEKHWKSLVTAYAHAPYWDQYRNGLEDLYKGQYSTLGEVNGRFLDFMIEQLRIDTKIVRMSDMDVDSAKSDLILDICTALGATAYLSGVGGKAYLDESSFSDAGITIEYAEPVQPAYKQFNGDFISGLSMLDMMLNVDVSEINRYLEV